MKFLPLSRFLVASTLLSLPLAAAEKEALVIGCAAYENITPLPLVATDVRDVAAALTTLGFHVTPVPDPGIEAFNTALLKFKTTAKGAKVVLVYYSGHGLEHEQENYLLPVDASLDSAAQLRSQAVNVDTLLSDLKATQAPARTVILDCCRDNPFGATVKSWRPATKSAVDANVLRALGEAEIPEATMIVFASSSGRKAASRLNHDSVHSPFTASFLEFIQSPGLSLRDVFDKVEDAVSAATENRQTPVTKYGGSSRVFRELVFLPGGPGVKPPPPLPPPPPPVTVTPATASRAVPFTSSLGLEFVPAGTARVLFSRTETRVRDFRAFATENAAFASTQESMQGYTLEKKGTDSYEWKLAGGTWADPHFTQTEEHPVVCVSLQDAEAFAQWLTTRERASGLIGPRDRYRLPVDEEWSTACGLGKYPWGSAWPPPEGAGNFSGTESKTGPANVPSWSVIAGYTDPHARTAPVAQYQENKYGLYDLSGNVWEWCSTEYRKTLNSDDVRKKIPALEKEKSDDGTPFRVLRGGSWFYVGPANLLSSFRYYGRPTVRYDYYGFRVVLVVGGGG